MRGASIGTSLAAYPTTRVDECLGFRAFYSSRRRACAEIHSIDGLRRSGYSFIIWEKNCNCVRLAARRPLASLRYFRVAAMFDGSSSRVLSL